MLLQLNIDTILRDHGMKGVFIVLGSAALVALGRAAKVVAQMIKSRIEASDAALAEVVKDARSERDAAKTAFMQALRDQTAAFERSSQERDRAMREGFNEVLHELRDNGKTVRRK